MAVKTICKQHPSGNSDLWACLAGRADLIGNKDNQCGFTKWRSFLSAK